jgi:trans-aconitate methyltransferase
MSTKLHCFEWIARNPKLQHAFDVTMTMRSKRSIGGAKWFEIYPIERSFAQEDPSQIFAVDVGGGIGHHMIELKTRYPDVPGKLIVQDIAAVIDSVRDLPPGIEAMAQDFFKPQPIRNAKIYYVAHVLHDWPDKQAKIILENVRDAMGPNSVLLLNDTVMPERNVPYFPAVMDLNMMASFSSLERTETQFRDLLKAAGLRSVQIWRPDRAESQTMSLGQSILEVQRI